MRITSVLIIAAMLAATTVIAAGSKAVPVVQGDLGQKLDAALTRAKDNGFDGNALVVQRGEVVLLKGYGLANEAADLRFAPDTLVQIGSNVKDFTKVAIYQLVEQGKLATSDTLDRFFDGVPADKRAITVQHLLTHRAGLPLGLEGGDTRALSRADLLRESFALKLAFAPGERQNYSNTGYALLAAIVEKTSGLPYDAYVHKHILQPAGLVETGSHAAKLDRARVAHGYRDGKDIGSVLDLPHDDTGHLYQLRGNGGYLSTLTEMHRFYRALLDDTLLKDGVHRRTVFDPDAMNIAAGSDRVSFFLFANFPNEQTQVFLASNHAGFPAPQALRAIEGVLGVAPPPGSKIVTTGPGGAGPASSAPLSNTLPDTGPGKTVAAYLKAYNSGDEAVMTRFFAEHTAANADSPPLEQRLERYRQMRGNLGALTFKGARAGAGEGMEVVCQGERGEQVTLGFELEAQAPYRLRGIRVQVGD